MSARSSSAGRVSRVRAAKRSSRGGWLYFCVFVMGALLVTLFLRTAVPKFGKAVYHFESLPEQYAQLPLFVPTAAPKLYVRFPLTLQRFSPRSYLIKPDDCIKELRVNKKIVTPSIANFCDYDDGKILDLSRYLHNGVNTLEFVIQDDGGLGGVNMTPASNDSTQLAAFTTFLILFLWYAFTLVSQIGISRERRLLASVFVGGIVLRILYVIGTPFRTRSYDVGGHLEYIEFIQKNWSIPLANNGWEYHQPPLYYWLCALWAKLNEFIGRTGDTVYNDLQTVSLFLSMAVLLISLWIARMLFPAKSPHKHGDTLFLTLLAILPSLVMFSSRVTNESLYYVFAFLGFALLVRWWNKKNMRDWYLALIVIIVGSLCKISAAGLFPVAFLCLLVQRQKTWRFKLYHGFAGFLLIAVLFGWYPVHRISEKNLANVVTLGNKNMNQDLAVPRSPSLYFTFNPVEVARLPFNDTWSENYRREYFWEFFYKSSFFGEFRFERIYLLGSIIVVLGMLFLPLLFLGFAIDMYKRRWYETMPIWLTTAILMAAALAYPTFFAYAPNQDFRFSILLAAPFAYYVVRGLQSLPGIPRKLLVAALVALAVSSVAFFIALYLRLN